MGLFDRLLGRSIDRKKQPSIKFGRYSDAYKSDEQYAAWQKSMDLFEQGNHFESYENFFIYLRDTEEDTVSFQRLGDTHLDFEILQGSKKIQGYVDGKKLKATVKVAKATKLSVGFMRRLIEKNFTLKHSRYALDESDHVVMIFDTYLLDGSPHKLYHALNEIATSADKMDDLLIEEFEMLEPVGNEHIKDLPLDIKKAKYDFIIHEIQHTLFGIESERLDANIYAQAIGYQLLNLVYKLDYLVRPEGFMMDSLESLNRNYFREDKHSTQEKNRHFIRELKELSSRKKESFFKEMYETSATFGMTEVVTQEKLYSFIDEVIREFDWYSENKHEEVALAITGYIVGYSLFHWAIPRPHRELFHLYYEITEHKYFESLGFTHPYYDEDGEMHKYSIRYEIDNIVKSNKAKYPNLVADTSMLEFDSPKAFARSFFLMIREMDATPV